MEADRVGRTEQWQFSGASLALTAGTYKKVGGLRPSETLEDEHLEELLRENGVPIERLLSVRATTSPRLEGRASRGLSHDLSRAALGYPVRAAGNLGTWGPTYWAFSSLYSWMLSYTSSGNWSSWYGLQASGSSGFGQIGKSCWPWYSRIFSRLGGL